MLLKSIVYVIRLNFGIRAYAPSAIANTTRQARAMPDLFSKITDDAEMLLCKYGMRNLKRPKKWYKIQVNSSYSHYCGR